MKYFLKKIMVLIAAGVETFFMLFFISSMFVSSVFYYIVRVITWPYRIIKNFFFGSRKKSLYQDKTT